MTTRKRPRFRIEDYRTKTDSLRVGCAPLLLAIVVLAGTLGGCVSRSVVRLNETTTDGTFRIVYRTTGDAHADQNVDYSGPDWRLRVGSDSQMTSPAHEEAARQLAAILAGGESVMVGIAKILAALP